MLGRAKLKKVYNSTARTNTRNMLSAMMEDLGLLETQFFANDLTAANLESQTQLLANDLAAAYQPADPYQSATWMVEDFGGEPEARGFFNTIKLALEQPGTPVAGSAALYMERLMSGRKPGFRPNDIDAWADTTALADALAHRSAAGSIPRISFMFKGRKTEDDWIPGFFKAFHAKSDTSSSLVALTMPRLGPDLQIMSMLHRPDTAKRPCRCDANSGCPGCIGGSETSYRMAGWPESTPHARFDLDATCVALKHGWTIDRIRGSGEGPTIRVLPAALLRVDDSPSSAARVTPAPILPLIARLKRYSERGYTHIKVPLKLKISGTVVETPSAVIGAACTLGLQVELVDEFTRTQW